MDFQIEVIKLIRRLKAKKRLRRMKEKGYFK